MHRKLAATALALPLAAGAQPATYEIDPDHTFPHFMIQHLGVSWMHGRFNKTSGKLVLDRAAKTGSVEVTIETASVDTGAHELRGRTRTRDEHLRTADFFNVQEFPTMTYKGSAKWNGEWPSEVQGQLTLLGVTRPVTLKVDSFGCAPDPRIKGKREVCGANASGSFKRSDFGMKFAIPGVSDEIRLQVQLEALRPL
ncbi:MAG: YceI family protein [Burkholderiales bacterium]|nr:YceI family protein [Burkholderiales bacterium]